MMTSVQQRTPKIQIDLAAARPADPTGHYFAGDEFWEKDGALFRYRAVIDPSDPDRLAWETTGTGVLLDGDFVQYLDATTGLDTNDGRTPETAIRTIAELQRRVPFAWRGQCRVFFAAGTYAWPGAGTQFVVGGPFNSLGTPGGIGEDMVWIGEDVAIQEGVVVTDPPPVSFPILVVVGGGWGDNELRGKFVRFTSGANEGIMLSVASNDANSINLAPVGTPAFIPTACLNADPAPGDTFDILEQGVVIDAGTSGTNTRAIWRGMFHQQTHVELASFKVLGGFQFEVMTAGLDRFSAIGDGNACFVNQYARVDAGGSIIDPNIKTCLHVASAGEPGSTISVIRASNLNAAMICDNVLWQCGDDSSAFLQPYFGVNSPLTSAGTMQVGLMFSTGCASGYGYQLEFPAPVTASAVFAGFGAAAKIAVANGFVWLNDYTPIVAAGGAYVTLIGVTNDPFFLGAPNADDAIVLYGGSRLYFEGVDLFGAAPGDEIRFEDDVAAGLATFATYADVQAVPKLAIGDVRGNVAMTAPVVP